MKFRSFLLVALIWAPSAFADAPPNPFLMAAGTLTPLERAEFLRQSNPLLTPSQALNLSLMYEEEADVEGVNPDLAFAQMLLETQFLRFGGQVKSNQNNFAGIGALDGGNGGLSFPSPREGVRAQIQHLKYYAGTAPLVLPPVNPRLNLIRRASAPTVWQLSGTWASDPDYGQKIEKILERMDAFADTASSLALSRHTFGSS